MYKAGNSRNHPAHVIKEFTTIDKPLTNPLLWIAFTLYIVLAGYTIAHHEMWGDEIHSWNIAKGSAGFFDLINNSRYEGHPPSWYVVLWIISKFTHDLEYVKIVHLVIASLSIFIILFFSSFTVSTRLLLPFGYYFLFEYAVISRNYAIAILWVCCICIIMRKTFRYKTPLYYLLLFLLSNTHLLAVLLAGSLHVYFLLLYNEQKKEKSTIALHALLGIAIALPAVYSIFFPSDSLLNLHFWANGWSIHKVSAFFDAPLRAFVPVPAWWNYNYWNTQFLVETRESNSLLRLGNLFIAFAIILAGFFIVKQDRKCLAIFLTNLILNFIVAVIVIVLGTYRYAGFIYIGFIASYWLYCYDNPITPRIKWMVNGLLAIQVVAGTYAVIKEIQYPFSNSYRVNELLKQIPVNEKVTSDYWGLNTVLAYTDKPVYGLDLQKDISFVLLDSDLKDIHNKAFRYFDGVQQVFKKEGLRRVYMISTHSPGMISRTDLQLQRYYRVILIDKIEGAIEKGSNLYLYQIYSY